MAIPVFAYKLFPFILKAASWKFRRSPQIMALLWLLPLLKQPANTRRRAARLQLLQMLMARTKFGSTISPKLAPYLRTWYENGARFRR